MDKTSLVCLVFFALISSSFEKEKRLDIVHREMDKLQEISSEIYKLLDDKVTDDQETFRLQIFITKFCLYAQDFLYNFNSAIIYTQDVKAIKMLNTMEDVVNKYTYEMGQRVADNDATKLKKVIRNAFEHYQTLFPIAVTLDKLLQNETHQVARYYTRMSYNIAIYNFNTAYGELKFRKKTAQEISNKIKELYKGIHSSLENLTNEVLNPNVLEEVQSHAQVGRFFTDRLFANIERRVNNDQNLASKDIATWVGDVAIFMKGLEQNLRSNITVAEMLTGFNTFFKQSTVNVQKLLEIEEKGDKYQKDTCKEILLEFLCMLSAFSDLIEILRLK